MLVSWNRTFGLTLVWSLDPVPSTISVPPESPGIEQTTLVCSPTSEADHHSCSTTVLAESCRVVHSDLRRLSSAVKLNPGEGSFLNTETPHVVYSLLASITAKY